MPARLRRVLAATLTAVLMGPAAAGAAGGYLHRAEADYLKHRVHFTGTVTYAEIDWHTGWQHRADCTRTGARTFNCPAVVRTRDLLCRWTITVHRLHTPRSDGWSVTPHGRDCRIDIYHSYAGGSK